MRRDHPLGFFSSKVLHVVLLDLLRPWLQQQQRQKLKVQTEGLDRSQAFAAESRAVDNCLDILPMLVRAIRDATRSILRRRRDATRRRR